MTTYFFPYIRFPLSVVFLVSLGLSAGCLEQAPSTNIADEAPTAQHQPMPIEAVSAEQVDDNGMVSEVELSATNAPPTLRIESVGEITVTGAQIADTTILRTRNPFFL